MSLPPHDFVDIEIPDYREITPDGRRMVLEVTVRRNGVWRVHSNDPDTVFPSDFHADRVDAPEKLDLYTGGVFSAIHGNLLRTEPKKVMLYIFRELQRCKEVRIQQRLRSTDRFAYLN